MDHDDLPLQSRHDDDQHTLRVHVTLRLYVSSLVQRYLDRQGFPCLFEYIFLLKQFFIFLFFALIFINVSDVKADSHDQLSESLKQTLTKVINENVSKDLQNAIAKYAIAISQNISDKNKPLLGLPLAPKDLLDVVGFPTTYGFPGYKNYFPKKNSLIVDRLSDAGAIFIGKTNTAELGVGGHTTNRLFGETSNPYNLSKSAGGSSGGAGVAVAANLLPFADGTDMMGSCRTPAAFANIYGFRPTPGPVSYTHLTLPTNREV